MNLTHIKGFNALRALSVTLVVLTHLDLSDWIPNTDFIMKRVWPLISGGVGVQIFFVISGYLITRILLSEQSKNGKINFKNFFARRFLRLHPPLLIFFLLLLVANQFDYLTNAKDSIFYAIFYIYNFVPRNVYSVEMGHLWSLAIEEQFYLMWPFALSIFRRKNVLVGIIGFLVAVSCFVNLIIPSIGLNEQYMLGRWFIPASCPLFIGCLGVLIQNFYPERTAKLMSSPLKSFAIILPTYLFTLYSPEKLMPLNLLMQSIAIIVFLMHIVYSQEKKWVQMLEWKPLAYIGIISYGIYVYQGFFLRTGGGSSLWFQQFPNNIILTMIVAILSYQFIEKPILRLKKRF